MAGVALGSLLAGFGGGVLAMRRAEPVASPAVAAPTPSARAVAPGLSEGQPERSVRKEHVLEWVRMRSTAAATAHSGVPASAARAGRASGVRMQTSAAPIVRAYGNAASASTPPGVVKIVIPPTILAPRTSAVATAR